MVDTKKRKMILADIQKSIKEYSTEEINDWESIKSNIEKILETHRPIKLCDYEYGMTMTLKNGNRIIVKEENDKTKVREYSKSNNSWICSNRHCKYATLKIKYGIVFAAITHNCEPREYSMALKIQELLKQGKTTEALGLTMKRRSLR
uniref:Uncharacterized protein n=1 Tax=Panagrolaimus davidi TaxID=227884 RepID=A0A914Q7C2_9BILA